MHFFNLVAAPLVALSALIGAATASPIEARAAGPSGKVISPAGGTSIYATQGYPTAKFHFVYKTVSISKDTDCAYFGCTAETWYTDVTLKGISGTKGSYKLAEYLAPQNQGGNIDTWLVAPANACGTFQLVVREYQNLYFDQINFQSAAPTVHINCSPLP